MNTLTDGSEANAITILVFSVSGIGFAVEASHVTVLQADSFTEDTIFISLAEKLGLSDSPRDFTEADVVLQFTNDAVHGEALFRIDTLDDMLEIPVSSIQLFPKVIAERTIGKGMWAIFNHHGKLLILVDFTRILAGNVPL